MFLNRKAIDSAKETDGLSGSLFGAVKDKNSLFLISHNSQTIWKMLDFFRSEDKVFILKGYSGSGKSAIIDLFLKNYIADDVLVFKHLFQTGTNLDDVLLSVYKDFTLYSSKKKIILPKIDSIIFSDKINSYIKHSFRQMVFVFDYFEMSFITQKKQDELCDFIKYLLKFKNVKIIIASRTLSPKDLKLDKFVALATLQPLNQDEIAKLLEQNDAKLPEEAFGQLCIESGGQYIFISMFLMLSKILDVKPEELFEEFNHKNIIFSDFLLQKNLALLSNKFLNLFYLLSVIRIGVSEKFILARKIAVKEDLEYLRERNIISYEFGLYYLKDYFKSKYLQSISPEVKGKIYSELITFYETLLPKKPFHRDLLISRITMRKEIEACRDALELLRLEKKKKTSISEKTNFSYLSYASQTSSEWGSPSSGRYNPTNIPKIRKEQEAKFGRANLSKEDVSILNLISPRDMLETELTNIVRISEELTSKNTKEEETKEDEEKQLQDLDELINKAKEKEEEFKYRDAIVFYEQALSDSENPLYESKKPLLVFKTAFCYKHIQETDKAVKLFEEASELYSKINSEKSIFALLCIAQSYSEVYRFEDAKRAYSKLLALRKILPTSIFVRANLDLAEIEDNNIDTEKAAGYANNALKAAEGIDNKGLLTESYFKYALYNDDLGNYSVALKYYLKCIQVSEDIKENAFLSPAYSNLAGLCYEKSDVQNAIMYHQKALEVDEKLNNREGLYFGYIKLAEIYKGKDYTKTYDYLIKALKVVRKTEDKTHLITVYMELGDCYFKTGKIRKSLRAYILAEKLIKQYSKIEEHYILEGKLAVIKNSVGQNDYHRYLSEIRKNEE